MMRWMPSCEEVTHLVSESMDRRLPLGRKMGMWFHLIVCRYCLRFRRQIMLLRKLSCLAEDAESDVVLPLEARERIKQALKNCGEKE